MEALAIARICHEAHRALCQSFGDMSQPTWAAAPVWIKKSAIEGVEFLREHPDASDGALHDNWVLEKDQDGWRYGKKDAEKKTHPCMVPFDQLPKEQQLKDVLFKAIVLALS